MGKIRFLYDNKADADDTTVTASTSNSDWPIANLQNPWPTFYHKTASLGSPDFWAWDLGENFSISYAILLNHNIRAAATVKLQADDSPDYGSLKQDITLVSGTHFDDNLLIYYFPTPVTDCRYWRITAEDAGNPDGYHRAGYAFLGSYFQPQYSYAQKSGGVVDPSLILLSDGGQPSVLEKDAFEVYEYEFSCAKPADLATLIAAFKWTKKGRPFFIVEDDDSRLSSTKYVRFSNDLDYGPFAALYKKYGIRVEESR